ncbi:MAG: DUF45 domain-containing protein [Gammaproteobacteria bacterium]|nr:DUF45 domain-containing protein [Gammaproteobacteria bacterium]
MTESLVVVPEKKRHYDTLAFINEHREWIEKQATRFTFLLPEKTDQKALLEKIELTAVNQAVEIIYRPINATTCVSHRVDKNKIIFFGAIDDFSVCVPIIMKYLKKEAKKYLGDLLNQLSIECDLPYKNLSIRAQKTVWGSLIHELCHTVHLNHSFAFWKLVGRFVPDFRLQVKTLREADRFLPRWLC